MLSRGLADTQWVQQIEGICTGESLGVGARLERACSARKSRLEGLGYLFEALYLSGELRLEPLLGQFGLYLCSFLLAAVGCGIYAPARPEPFCIGRQRRKKCQGRWEAVLIYMGLSK